MQSELNDTSKKHVQQDDRQEKNNIVPKAVFNHPHSLSRLRISLQPGRKPNTFV